MKASEQREASQEIPNQTGKTQKPLKYNLLRINKVGHYVNSLETLQLKSLEGETISISKGYNISFTKEPGILTIRTKVDFQCRLELGQPSLLFGVVVQYDYLFQDYEGIVKGFEENKVEIPNDLLVTLLSVSFSTTRGVLVELTAGTEYKNIYLPLIDIQEFVKLLNPPVAPESK